MTVQRFDYVIVGGGLAGASAIDGIRERDPHGSILLVGEEDNLPYDRPPLSKKLWFGKMKLEQVFLHPKDYYSRQAVTMALGSKVTQVDPKARRLTALTGAAYQYGKLLLATGSTPRILPIPGGNLPDILYYRGLNNYIQLRSKATPGASAVVVGGGFIGSEIAAALKMNQVNVTMIFPSRYLCDRVFPDYFGLAVQEDFKQRGIKILDADAPVSFRQQDAKFITQTRNGRQLESDILIVGVGVEPEINLADAAGLAMDHGIAVDEYLQTSDPDIYAAGDNARFPYGVLGKRMRLEHWDNALNQGKYAGRNMAGAKEPFTYMPYFFSDLFDLGYEATGDVSAEHETFADWQTKNAKGVIYYLKDRKVRGIMLVNVWERVEAAREIIRQQENVTPEKLRGRIK